jgi:hypothetical protein
VGRNPDRARAPTDDPRDLGDVEPGHDTQDDYLGLITRQRCDECERCLGRYAFQDLGGSIVGRGAVHVLGIRGWPFRMPCLVSPQVDHPTAGHGEEPTAEFKLATAKPGDPPRDFKPHFAG